MIHLWKKIWAGRGKPHEDFKALIEGGAVIVDVRSLSEFREGHITGAHNIPLDTLGRKDQRIGKDKAIITCCASGMRSASAKRLLEAKGYKQVYNGGGWRSLQQKIK